jgi:prepilin-type N-terminal cleavage/methylation domain-containing protein
MNTEKRRFKKGARQPIGCSSAFIRVHPRFRFSPGRSAAPGFTLLEVILSLVVLGAALAMLGEIMQLANRNASDARAETQAQLLAASLMDQIMAGAIKASDASGQPLDVDDATPWLYSVSIGTSELEGILPVEVLVEQDLEPQFNPVKYRLLRWLPTYPETPESMEAAPGAAAGSEPGRPGPGGGQL